MDQLEQFAEKISLLLDKNKQEADEQFEEINTYFGNIRNYAEDKLKQLKKYVDDKCDDLSKSRISNINMRGETHFNNKSSINYNDKTE